MIQVQDFTASVSERKTVRKELSLKPSVEQKIKQAANMTGMDISTFIASAAYEKAQAIEQSQFTTVLDTERFDAFANAVDAKGKAIEGLTNIMKKNHEMLVNG